MKRAWVSKQPSTASGPGAAPDPARPAIPALDGPIFWVRSVRPVALRRGWSCPSAGLVLPFGTAMNAHMAQIARTVAPGAYALLILDGAGWHGSAALTVPNTLSVLTLPPSSADLNLVENVWACLRATRRAITVFDTDDDMRDACRTAWNFLANDPNTIAAITQRSWAKVYR